MLPAGPQIPRLVDPAWYFGDWQPNHGTLVTPNSAPIILREANPHRTYLFATSSNGVWFRWGINNDINGLEYLLTIGGSSSAYFQLDLGSSGGLCQQTIYVASHTGSAVRISWIEMLWLPKGS